MEYERLCNECNILKSISEFRHQNRKSKKRGCFVYISRKCKKCELIKNRNSHNKATKKYYNKNKEYYGEYYSNNNEKLKLYRNTYRDIYNLKRRERRKNDINYKIKCNLRCRIRKALKSTKTNNKIKLLGCSIKQFKNWLEWRFDSNMTWNNYGIYWDIDHVIPCSSFELTRKKEQLICFNWKNCQPLKSSKNYSKKNKIIPIMIILHEIRLKHYCKISNISYSENFINKNENSRAKLL